MNATSLRRRIERSIKPLRYARSQGREPACLIDIKVNGLEVIGSGNAPSP
jgi:hypothetical protein